MTDRQFHMKILGRTIEHLGTQMYKQRAPSIAELVANCWDAGANLVVVTVPSGDSYDPLTSRIAILDDGDGMDEDAIQDQYLVVGRNRRQEGDTTKHGRRVMGRKGIGKLAGFGLAGRVTVTTWTADAANAISFSMSLEELKAADGEVENVAFPWMEVDKPPEPSNSGTRVELSELRHLAPIDIEALQETLARRFSRTARGQMEIRVNGSTIADPQIDAFYTFPDEPGDAYAEEQLPDGQQVRYRYSFAKKPLRSKELQGFVIYSSERTAQAPPFFFNVESTASSQHSTRYVTGEIVADYLDRGADEATDVISTDRQELDWDKEQLAELRKWGAELSRRVLRECAELRGKQVEDWVLNHPDFLNRLELLDKTVKKEIGRFLKILGEKTAEDDPRTLELADSLIRAYEFRNFHDVIDDIEQAAEDPGRLEELLGRLYDWKVLESRAILEIVRGRLSIIEKLETMIVNDAPETASSKTYDNLHDLLAEYPWLFNPEWQTFVDEKSIGKQLREWGETDCPDDMKEKRVDFLAFAKETDTLVIIDLKRPGHAVELDEVQRLEKYQVALMQSRPDCRRVLVHGGQVNIPSAKWEEMLSADDFECLTWSEMFRRAKSFYSHYEAVLNGDPTAVGFRSKEVEVARTRQILETGSTHRSREDRRRGVGNSDA